MIAGTWRDSPNMRMNQRGELDLPIDTYVLAFTPLAINNNPRTDGRRVSTKPMRVGTRTNKLMLVD